MLRPTVDQMAEALATVLARLSLTSRFTVRTTADADGHTVSVVSGETRLAVAPIIRSADGTFLALDERHQAFPLPDVHAAVMFAAISAATDQIDAVTTEVLGTPPALVA
jgi:hypothetical protein